MMMFKAAGDDSVVARSVTPCRVSFLRGEAVMRRCEHACACHGRMVENLFHLVTEKAMFLSERVEVLSRRSIREKLLRYFQLQAAKAAFFPQCAGGLYLRRPQRHDARAEENAGGNAGDHHWATGDAAIAKHARRLCGVRVLLSGDMPVNSCQKCVRCALTAGHHRDKINKVPGVACEKGAGKEKTEMRE